MSQDLSEIDGWIVKERSSDYNFVYLIAWILTILMDASSPPPPPDIIYTLENRDTGATRTITLAGDHKRDDLIAEVKGLQ